MLLDRGCDRRFSLHKDALLIRCIAENKEGWSCPDGSARDYCPDHAALREIVRLPRNYVEDPFEKAPAP